MATETKPKTSDEKSEPRKKPATAPNEIVRLSEDERVVRPVRERQFPSLYNESAQAIEIGERTIDNGDELGVAEPTMIHVKDFVTLARDLETEGEDAVHARNINAVRQYMVNQGIRPDAKVSFMGKTDLGGPPGRKSVALRYGVHAIPAVVATDFDVRHVTIPQEGPSATERAEYDASREDRLKAGHDAARAGTPEADRPNAPKE